MVARVELYLSHCVLCGSGRKEKRRRKMTDGAHKG
jgi:hypothetical protein